MLMVASSVFTLPRENKVFEAFHGILHTTNTAGLMLNSNLHRSVLSELLVLALLSSVVVKLDNKKY
jgi:hypothetical protein